MSALTAGDAVDRIVLAESDKALLTAALSLDAEVVACAWRAWRAATDLDVLSATQFPLLPRLYAHLSRFGLADAADPRIKGVYRRTWYANQWCTRLAAVAFSALGGAGIPAALGGAAAVQDLYAGPGERPIGQIELLVAPADVTRTAEALGRIGWQPVRAPVLLTDPGYRQWVSQARFHLTSPPPLLPGEGEFIACTRSEFILNQSQEKRARIRPPLVLVWRLLPAAPAPGEAARFTALALDAGAAPPRLRREAQLIVACARAAEGGPGRLIALADACMILRSPTSLDWERVLDLAGLLATARPLAAALPLVAELSGQPFNERLLPQLAQMGRDEPPYECLDDARALMGRVRFHWRRWRRIAYVNGELPTPLSLLRYLRAAAGVTRLR